MQCLTQLASPVHLPGSSRGSTLTFTRHDKPLLGQSHSSVALSPPSCTLIMTWCICACHTLEGGHLSSVKYRSLPAPKWSHSSGEPAVNKSRWGSSGMSQLFTDIVSAFCVACHEVPLGLCYSLATPKTLMYSLGQQRRQPRKTHFSILEIFSKLPGKVVTDWLYFICEHKCALFGHITTAVDVTACPIQCSVLDRNVGF